MNRACGHMKGSTMDLPKLGGLAALCMAAAYAVGIMIFLVVLDYPNITDPAQKVALLINQPLTIFATNLILYVVFGFALIVLLVALHGRMQADRPATVTVASVIGIIWAGSLIASGMVANAGIAQTVALFAVDPEAAARIWEQTEAIAGGLGNSNGEVLGGMMTLLFSWAGLRSGTLPKAVSYLGVLVGAIGIASTAPGLVDLVGVFGITQLLWFVGLAFVLLRSARTTV